jgi:hypothetical protein
VEVEQSTELTGTNRSCGLTILLRQSLSLAPGVRVTSITLLCVIARHSAPFWPVTGQVRAYVMDAPKIFRW